MITGFGFVGIRSERAADLVKLFALMGLTPDHKSATTTSYRLADGALLEVYNPQDDFHSFFTTGPVVAYRVDDLTATRNAMLAAGIQFIGDVQTANGVSWQHFHAPDGAVMEIIGP